MNNILFNDHIGDLICHSCNLNHNISMNYLHLIHLYYNILLNINYYGKRPDHAGSEASDGVIISLKLLPVKSIILILGGVILFFFILV